MDDIITLASGLACLLAPMLFVALAGLTYLVSIGAINIPGIARKEIETDHDLITVSALAHRAGDTVSATVGMAGAFFGLLGYLMPWVHSQMWKMGVDFSSEGLNGTLGGIAFLFQALLEALQQLAEGNIILGIYLLVVSLAVSFIAFMLVISAAMSLGVVSVPLGITKNLQYPRLSRVLLVLTTLALATSCVFFVITQATVNGLKLGSSGDEFGGGYYVSLEVAPGFWVTVGGLVLAVVGAIAANMLGKSLSSWSERLTSIGVANRDPEK